MIHPVAPLFVPGNRPERFAKAATSGADALTETDSRHAADLGFLGKLLIHARQVPPALRGFAPSAAEVEWVRKLMGAGGEGAVAAGAMMIDAPVRICAERIVARATV
jgi:citrate lyase subunit beta/citryl-CoA lyase